MTNNTTEPAALAGIDPVAWLNNKLPHMAVLTKPDDGGGWFPVVPAATVEQLVQERDELKDTNWYLNGIKDDRLAASQAREQQLREALKQMVIYARDMHCGLKIADDALMLPQDDTALKQYGAKLLREMADVLADRTLFKNILRRKADELEAIK